jgi:hypothetical protein
VRRIEEAEEVLSVEPAQPVRFQVPAEIQE